MRVRKFLRYNKYTDEELTGMLSEESYREDLSYIQRILQRRQELRERRGVRFQTRKQALDKVKNAMCEEARACIETRRRRREEREMRCIRDRMHAEYVNRYRALDLSERRVGASLFREASQANKTGVSGTPVTFKYKGQAGLTGIASYFEVSPDRVDLRLVHGGKRLRIPLTDCTLHTPPGVEFPEQGLQEAMRLRSCIRRLSKECEALEDRIQLLYQQLSAK